MPQSGRRRSHYAEDRGLQDAEPAEDRSARLRGPAASQGVGNSHRGDGTVPLGPGGVEVESGRVVYRETIEGYPPPITDSRARPSCRKKQKY